MTNVHLADDWNGFIITSSVWAAQGLIPDEVLKMWSHFVNAYVSLLQSRELTMRLEKDAANELKKFATAVEEVTPPPNPRSFESDPSLVSSLPLKHLPISACTISVHLAAVEAHLQVPMTGPIREAMSSWIERLNFTLVEQTQRRSASVLHLSALHPLTFFRLPQLGG